MNDEYVEIEQEVTDLPSSSLMSGPDVFLVYPCVKQGNRLPFQYIEAVQMECEHNALQNERRSHLCSLHIQLLKPMFHLLFVPFSGSKPELVRSIEQVWSDSLKPHTQRLLQRIFHFALLG